MKNDHTTRSCKFCSASFTVDLTARPQDNGKVYCGGDCAETHHRMMNRSVYSTDDGYDAYRDSRMDAYNPKDWQWGSWDK